MKKILSLLIFLSAYNVYAQESFSLESESMRYIRRSKPEDMTIFEQNKQKNLLFVNEEITTHIIFPENIKMMDISTDKLVGNQCFDNIVRIKPANRMMDNEITGTITIIGERHIAQYTVIYTGKPSCANSIFDVEHKDMRPYQNPDVLMPVGDMANYAWAIYSSKRKFNNIKASAYGLKAVVNNIYTVGDYFFIDFSLYNNTKVKYDIEEMRIKLTDKKETKATNSQTIELSPEFSINNTKSFKKSWRNVIVLKKLTFPNGKVLRIEISENQISGRVIVIPVEYQDILNADGFSEELLKHLSNKSK